MGTATIDRECVIETSADEFGYSQWSSPTFTYRQGQCGMPIAMRPGAFTESDIREMEQRAAAGIGRRTRPFRRVPEAS